MSEWKVLTAEDFCDSVRDGTHDTPKQVECGYKLVTAKHQYSVNSNVII